VEQKRNGVRFKTTCNDVHVVALVYNSLKGETVHAVTVQDAAAYVEAPSLAALGELVFSQGSEKKKAQKAQE
jgi:hypothetical protein